MIELLARFESRLGDWESPFLYGLATVTVLAVVVAVAWWVWGR